TGARHEQAVDGELLAVLIVQLVAVPVPLVDQDVAVGLVGQAALDQLARVRPQAHGAAFFGDGVLLVEHAHHRMRTIAVEFGAIGVAQADDVAGELDDRALQAQADAEEGDAAFAGVADGVDLAAGTAVVEAARHQDAVHAAEHALRPFAL